jgi:pSer/pThr/pTyr-binding forkhead associated (FHA) protein
MTQKTKVLNTAPPQIGWLAVVAGQQRGRDFRLGPVTNIGRDASKNDIILDDDAVSAEHARVKLERKQFVLYDLASTNGTFVNGQRTQRHVLFDKDEIVIGETTLIFSEVKSQ